MPSSSHGSSAIPTKNFRSCKSNLRAQVGPYRKQAAQKGTNNAEKIAEHVSKNSKKRKTEAGQLSSQTDPTSSKSISFQKRAHSLFDDALENAKKCKIDILGLTSSETENSKDAHHDCSSVYGVIIPEVDLANERVVNDNVVNAIALDNNAALPETLPTRPDHPFPIFELISRLRCCRFDPGGSRWRIWIPTKN
ncbi:hypothetical protein L596_026424 [Steinernema carpocapsae]|uniref:Uncharacterized protein n=1 Tax=Steinernema carpocapsae TaxID=34508 RepID=A0A4U5M1A5_STECR|nr:hypothetical protein L596_026424 [Steinernema carpocapsae]